MMSGHGANSIFCNQKIKIGRPKHLLIPHALRPITSHFYLTPLPPQSGRHMCINPNQYPVRLKSNKFLIIWAPTLQNGQTRSNNLSATADELLEFAWPFCEVGAWRVNFLNPFVPEGNKSYGNRSSFIWYRNYWIDVKLPQYAWN